MKPVSVGPINGIRGDIHRAGWTGVMVAVGPPQLALALGDHLVLAVLTSVTLQDRAVEMFDYLLKDFL